MRITIQAERIDLLKEALASKCNGVRFGSEFCEWKLPKLEALTEAVEEAMEAKKAFTYVTPLLSNRGVRELREHFTYLNGLGGIEVVVGDLGALNMIQNYRGLQPRLGRSRVYIPARCPWPQITRMPNPTFLTRRKVEKIFYQTSLNYRRALEYYRALGVTGADVDWIPKCFPYLEQVVKRGFRLSIHTYAIPVTVTERCHMARLLGEKEPALCTFPCLRRTFKITQKELGRSFMLQGNVVFSLVEPEQRDIRELHRMGVEELVIPAGPVSRLMTTKDMDAAITVLARGV
ncbi:MAG: hypothetical protein QXI32_03705 [Candidatus Bathyarchaeia archaeon]